MSREDEYWRKRADRLERDLIASQREVERLGKQNDALCDQVWHLQQKLKSEAA